MDYIERAVCDPTKCFLCDKTFTIGETEFIGKGIPHLINASKLKNDGKHELLRDVEVIQVHKACKINYLQKETPKIVSYKKSMENVTKIEEKKVMTDFDFKNNCILCGQPVKDQVDSRPFQLCTTTNLKDRIIEKALYKQDDYSRKIVDRIKDANLILIKAIYHEDCYTTLVQKSPTTRKKGRPEDKNIILAFEKVCDYINESDERQFTLRELLERVQDNLPNEGTISMKTLKMKLQKKYGDGIVFATSFIKPSSIYFLDSGVKHREELRNEKKRKLR
ncbi:uncharacterized protein LOC130891766 [Diorhabda carinulata]|uniref:uncharacterized protein LOC130891766 n=1 Tax=Diorhabda carinulata TaxID=1163345 RepID=UPI0025A13055|nr:uncharacterized protein LOC130891766 [Diorhabda carinulata]